MYTYILSTFEQASSHTHTKKNPLKLEVYYTYFTYEETKN